MDDVDNYLIQQFISESPKDTRLSDLTPAQVQFLDKFPNISMMLRGCVSGSYSEWPRLRSEIRELLELIPADKL